MKQIGIFVKIVSLVAALILLAGCAGRGDWDCDLINGYCLIRSNAHSVQLCRSRDPEGGAWDHVLENYYVVSVAVSDPYIGLAGIPTERDAASDKELDLAADKYEYYLLDSRSGSVYGPYTKDEFQKKCADEGIDGLDNWVTTEAINSAGGVFPYNVIA